MPTLLDRQKEFTRYLVAGFPDLKLGGLPLKSACAVTGNATQENLVKPVTTGTKDHGSDGVLQWRLDRLDGPHGLKGWSAAQGLPWDTLKTQAAFFLWELHRDYPALESDVREGKKSIETLTANICRQYERPSNAEYTPRPGEKMSGLDKRISHANSVFKIMSKEAAPTIEAAVSGATIAGASVAGSIVANMGGDAWQTGLSVGAMALVGAVAYAFMKWRETPPAVAPIETDTLAGRIYSLTKALEIVAAETKRLADRLAEMKALAATEPTPTALADLEALVATEPAETGIEGLS